MPFIYASFALLGLPSIVISILVSMPTSTPDALSDLDTYFALFYCGIGAVFDNAAKIYLTWLVCRKSQIRVEARKKGLLGRLIVMIVAKCLIDWTCISLVAATGSSYKYYSIRVKIAASLTGIHVAIIALFLIELQKLALEHALHRYQSTQGSFNCKEEIRMQTDQECLMKTLMNSNHLKQVVGLLSMSMINILTMGNLQKNAGHESAQIMHMSAIWI